MLYQLKITDALPLEFEGDILYSASSSWTRELMSSRYHILQIYQAQGTDFTYYVVYIGYVSQRKGELSIFKAWSVSGKDEIELLLGDYDPLQHFNREFLSVPLNEKLQEASDCLSFDWAELKVEALKTFNCKRKGRPSVGDEPRIKVTLTMDADLRKEAQHKNINLSALLHEALMERLKKSC
jgi:Post-segregation antitoxin CcdA